MKKANGQTVQYYQISSWGLSCILELIVEKDFCMRFSPILKEINIYLSDCDFKMLLAFDLQWKIVS